MSADSPKTESKPEDDVVKAADRLYDLAIPPATMQ
jgi:hypothetical protein